MLALRGGAIRSRDDAGMCAVVALRGDAIRSRDDAGMCAVVALRGGVIRSRDEAGMCNIASQRGQARTCHQTPSDGRIPTNHVRYFVPILMKNKISICIVYNNQKNWLWIFNEITYS